MPGRAQEGWAPENSGARSARVFCNPKRQDQGGFLCWRSRFARPCGPASKETRLRLASQAPRRNRFKLSAPSLAPHPCRLRLETRIRCFFRGWQEERFAHGRFSVGSSTAGAATLPAPAPVPSAPAASLSALATFQPKTSPAGARPKRQTQAAVAQASPVPSGTRAPLSFGAFVAFFPGQMAASRSRAGEGNALPGLLLGGKARISQAPVTRFSKSVASAL